MSFPIGFHRFHRKAFINYQLNRIHAQGFTRKADLETAAARIKTYSDYVRVMEETGWQAEEEGRLQHAAFYYRAAEFFIPPSSPAKIPAYERFITAFYRAFSGDDIRRHQVPYQQRFLPANVLEPKSPNGQTLLFFGGFDSLIEEFFGIWRFFADRGYRVIAFEGPGQGGALRTYGHFFDHDYEKPVAAVLDYFQVEKAVLLGMSMGGYWAIRAAAFEPRIKQVIAFGVVYDWLSRLPGFAEKLVKVMSNWRGFMNFSVGLRMRLIPVLDYTIQQILFFTGQSEPVDAVRWFLQMNRDHIHSGRVTQDVLLLAGEKDTFQPPALLRQQAKALVNARSVNSRIFTKKEHAASHCQMGNLGLALNYMAEWLENCPDPNK